MELWDCNRKEYIIERLRAIQQAVESNRNPREAQDGYYVIEFQYESHSVEITYFSHDKLEQATAKYEEAELQNKFGGQRLDSVLVSAHTFMTLRKAYPNYFSDIRDFTQIVENLLNKVKVAASNHMIKLQGLVNLHEFNFTHLSRITEYTLFAPACIEAEKIYASFPCHVCGRLP